MPDLARVQQLWRYPVKSFRGNTMLGVYADVVSPGMIRVGDAVTLTR